MGLCVLLSCAYFYNGAAWNQNARLDPIFAFVEPGPDQGAFRIDRFLYVTEQGEIPRRNTGDWAYHDGHFYSNKAPGTTLIGIPFYLVLYHGERIVGIDVQSPVVQAANAYLINLWLSGAFLALAVVAFRRLMEQRGSPPGDALLAALLLFFATGLFPYATQLWGHTTAAAFLVLALYAQARPGRGAVEWAGFAAGLAVLVEYSAILFVLALGTGLLLQHWRRALGFALGGLLPLALFLYYHWICFDAPLGLATGYSNPAFLDDDRQLGLLALPSIEALYGLTFSPYRGLFVQMPVLLPCLLGLGLWLWRRPGDVLAWVVLATLTGQLLLIAGFNGWHGGATVLGRYLIPVLPLLLLAVGEVLRLRWTRPAVLVTGALSAANMLVIAAISPLSPDSEANPLYGLAYELFMSGRLHQFAGPIRLHALLPDQDRIAALASWNLGELMGLDGLASLVPLVLLWGLLMLAIWRALRREGPAR